MTQSLTASTFQNPYSFFIKKWIRSSYLHVRTSSQPFRRLKMFMSSSAEMQSAITSKVCPTSSLFSFILASTSGNEQQIHEQSKRFFALPSSPLRFSHYTLFTSKTKHFPEHKNTLKYWTFYLMQTEEPNCQPS
jgi:hypothetical protein